MAYFTSCAWMAERGDPLATEADWEREMRVASNPRADTRTREQALAYVEQRKGGHQPNPNFEDAPQPPPRPRPMGRMRAMQTERENLKLMIAGLKGTTRTQHAPSEPLKPAQPLMQVLRVHANTELAPKKVNKPEPETYPAPKPWLIDPEEVKRKREEHEQWMAEQFAKATERLRRQREGFHADDA